MKNNYIQSLQSENQQLLQGIVLTQEAISNFRIFLNSSKFTGTENGERKDWIATGDVLNWLSNIRNQLTAV